MYNNGKKLYDNIPIHNMKLEYGNFTSSSEKGYCNRPVWARTRKQRIFVKTFKNTIGSVSKLYIRNSICMMLFTTQFKDCLLCI